MSSKTLIESMRLGEEKDLLRFMEEAMNASAIQQLLFIDDKYTRATSLSPLLKGYLFPLSERVGENYYRLCKEVQDAIGYDEREVEFYVSSDPEINASSIYSPDKKEPNFVILNARLFDLLGEDGVKFVLGHELGHLIYEHSLFNRVMHFVYPDFASMPPMMKSLYDLWSKLSEISADRVGLFAVKSIDKALNTMFQMSTGLDDASFRFSKDEFLLLTDQLLRDMKENPAYTFHSHPAHPIRAKAAVLFYESKSWQELLKGGPAPEDKELEHNLNELVTILRKKPESAREMAELNFLCCAGLLLMTCDSEVSPGETDYLLNILSRYLFWPRIHLDAIVEEKKAVELLTKSSAYIVEKCPQRARDLLAALIPILTRDRKLATSEVDYFTRIGIDYLKIPPPEVIDILLRGLRELYAPMA